MLSTCTLVLWREVKGSHQIEAKQLKLDQKKLR